MSDPVVSTEPPDETSYSSQSSSNQSVIPGSAQAALVKQSSVLSSVSQQRQGNLGVMLNASLAPKKVDTASVPEPLVEVPETAYAKGVAYPITLVVVDSIFLMEKATGYDFILMRRAAMNEAKVRLTVNSAFRSMVSQTRIAADHALHPEKGPAATPGFSNHQQGLSLDIHTGIKFADWKSGTVLTSPEHTWLMGNAKRFGFDQRDLGLLPDGRRYEPWHWTHAADGKIYGITDANSDGELQDLYAGILSAGDESAYNATGAPDLFRLVLKLGSDLARGWERSASGFTTTRQTFYSAAAIQATYQSAAGLQRGAAQTYPMELTPPSGFAGNPPLYNFESGMWSDEEGSENVLGI